MERNGGDRPDWCAKVECAYFRSMGRCQLRNSVIVGFVSQGRRNLKYREFREMSVKNPNKLIELCRQSDSATKI